MVNKSIIVAIMAIFLLNLVAAETIKTYNENNKILTFKEDNTDSMTVKLLYHSTQCTECSDIWEIDIKKDNLKGILGRIEFEDLKQNKIKKVIPYKLEFLNGTNWQTVTDIDKLLINKGTFKVKLTGYKQANEIIDYVPTFLGIEAREWAVWGVTTVYDEIDDSSINLTLWNYSMTCTGDCDDPDAIRTVTENGAEIYNKIETEIDNAMVTLTTTHLNTTNLPSIEAIENITFSAYARVASDRITCVDTTSLNAFGNTIHSLSQSEATGEISDDSIWTLIKNYTAGSNKYDIYNDGVKTTQITATNNRIRLYGTSQAEEISFKCYSEMKIRYVYYSTTNNSLNITINSPVNHYIQTSSTNSTINVTNIAYDNTLKNTSLYVNGTRVETKTITGTTNTSIFSYSFAEGNNTYYIYTCDNLNQCKASETRELNRYPFNVQVRVYDSLGGSEIYPTCYYGTDLIIDNYLSMDRPSKDIDCELPGYVSDTMTVTASNGNEQSFTMTKPILNLTFSEATNITLTSSTFAQSWNMNTSIIKNQSDLPTGTIIITFGNSQIFSYYNDNATAVTETLYVTSTDLVKKIRVVQSGSGINQATVKLYKNVAGTLQLITSGVTDVNGYISFNINDDDTYTAVVTKTDYTSKTETKYIPTTDTEIWTIDIQKTTSTGKTNHFSTNCPNKISKTTSCYFEADLYQDYDNITIIYYLNTTAYSKQCLSNDYCKTSTLSLTNLNTPAVANIYLDGYLWNQTLYVNYVNLSSKNIQITLPYAILKTEGNETYLYTFYVIALLIGIVIAVAFNHKIAGSGIYALVIWFGILATAGFPEFWLIVLPITIIMIGKEMYRWIK